MLQTTDSKAPVIAYGLLFCCFSVSSMGKYPKRRQQDRWFFDSAVRRSVRSLENGQNLLSIGRSLSSLRFPSDYGIEVLNSGLSAR
jgi:hypothetical protein